MSYEFGVMSQIVYHGWMIKDKKTKDKRTIQNYELRIMAMFGVFDPMYHTITETT